MVLQEPFLFTGTIAENIAYGRPGATRAEIEAAARAVARARLHRRAARGLRHACSARAAATLSQGQRQLLAFARAVLADPRILILDEATANIDTRTEALIQRALGTLLAGRTSVVIAHRLSTIRNADLILVLDAGPDRRARHPPRPGRARRRLRGAGGALRGCGAPGIRGASTHSTHHVRMERAARVLPGSRLFSERGLQSMPRYSLACCVIYRDEAHYLPEWLRFHERAGVEHFFLYDNGSSDEHRDVIAGTLPPERWTLIDWPGMGVQRSAYQHCLENFGADCRWLAFIDVDEFLFSPTGRDLRQELEDFTDVPAVAVNAFLFGSSGHEARPPGLVTQSYLWRARETTVYPFRERLRHPGADSRTSSRATTRSART